MHFAPIPTTYDAIGKTAPLWLPLAEKLSKRKGGETFENILSLIKNFQIQIGLIWDDDKKEARALVGWEFKRSGNELIAEVRWANGVDMASWRDLIIEMERYFKEHVGCTRIRAFPRPGWRDFLRGHDYKVTHLVMEKQI